MSPIETQIRKILKGIDEMESNTSSGWWETSTGADFGARKLQETISAVGKPIPMILICPNCNNQHVDGEEERIGWTNPPHKSHLCHFCGCVWRPCDYATTGVKSITTRGENDNVEVNTFTTARAFSMQEAAQFKFLEPGDVVEVGLSPGRMVRFRVLLDRKEGRQ